MSMHSSENRYIDNSNKNYSFDFAQLAYTDG